MSSILRALKKLESDPRHLEESGTLESKFVPLADTRQHKKPTGLLIVIMGGGIVCGLVLLAGWWLLSEKTLQSPIAPQQITRQNLQQPEKTPIIPKESESHVDQDISLEPAKPSADIVAVRKTADSFPEPTPETLPQPSSPTIEQKEILPIAEQAVEPTSPAPETPYSEVIEPVSTEKVAVAETSPPQISAKKAEKVDIPLLDNPEIKLQAITWSKDPQKRIAVINNSILRQGEAVSGYRIDTINQDDVVLTDKERKWKLLFRIR